MESAEKGMGRVERAQELERVVCRLLTNWCARDVINPRARLWHQRRNETVEELQNHVGVGSTMYVDLIIRVM